MQKIKKMQLHEIAAQEIVNYIQENGMQKGDKLPSLEEMSKLLDVSRTSIREALRALEAMEFVKMYNGKGVYVDDPSSYRFSTKIDVSNEKTLLLQACQVRRALEGLAVELATEYATEEQIERMMRYLDEIKNNPDGPITNLADKNFHQTIYEASRNTVLQSIITSLSTLFDTFWESAPLGQQSLFQDTFPFHPAIAEAIANRDKQEAAVQFNRLMDAIEQNIQNVATENK
ncbi:FadR/GntR family transcriptional regulator [Paenibacillus guangzhouensis]|uniref:FadR/GntR family transcriptional regulator n=1 Tax=Paenibacillus guangzhouensis TaxID=1473112 RepID=UPI0012669E8A|nr:FadR/GntR family transcriptional regulator [Paenibacillus guangzhouensis]